MKHVYILLVLVPTILFGNTTQPKPSTIKKVTVFLEGASIERTAHVTLTPGTNELLFNDLSPDIDESSIQISGLEEASILSIKFDIDYLEKKKLSNAYVTFQKHIDSLVIEEIKLQNQITGFKEELNILSANQKINNYNTELSLERVKEMSTYYRTRTTAINDAIYQLQLQIVTIKSQINDYAHERKKLDDTEKEKRGNIHLKLDSNKATRLDLQIKYAIKKAGWFPLYDIKATNTDVPLDFSYKANVYQQSGVDWKDVTIVLSTGDPNIDNSKPVYNTKYLNFVSNSYRPVSSKNKEIYKYNPTITNVSGTVNDDNGLPLPGCNIIVKGTNNGTQTDFDGNYNINVSGNRELVFSYIGFETQELPIYSSTMNVNLEADSAALEEVVIVGYGSSGRSRKSPPKQQSIEELLQGKISGVNTSSASGLTGATSNIKIRGASTIRKSAKPLFVIDGVAVNYNDVGYLNSNDILEVNVLKDASATAIYGNRASDGVIIITTKQRTGNGTFKETSITNTRFEMEKEYTINSNQDITVIEIDAFKIDASYIHYAAPEVNENVFITATITNWEQYNLLAGDANIYFDGSYAGKSHINPNETTKKLELSLGIDPAIVVKREKLNNFKSKSFLGTNRIVDKGYSIVVKNNKLSPVNLVLEERIPISQNKEIKVVDINTTDSDYDSTTGMLKWQLQLIPKQSVTKEFSYKVKFPKWRKISL